MNRKRKLSELAGDGHQSKLFIATPEFFADHNNNNSGYEPDSDTVTSSPCASLSPCACSSPSLHTLPSDNEISSTTSSTTNTRVICYYCGVRDGSAPSDPSVPDSGCANDACCNWEQNIYSGF